MVWRKRYESVRSALYPLNSNMKECIAKKQGFTIIEVIVSVSLFITVMVVSTSALLAIIDANKKSQSVRAVLDSLTLAVENMTRDIRTGTQYRCGEGGATGNTGNVYPNCPVVSSSDTYNRVFVYCDKELGTDVYFKFDQQENRIMRGVDQDGQCGIETSWVEQEFTSPDVFVEDMRFHVSGSNDFLTPNDPYNTLQTQPSALLMIKGYAGTGKHRTDFLIQTTTTQRDSD